MELTISPPRSVSGHDVSAFSEELTNGQIVRFEDFTNDLYLDSLIDKPWGHEYRVYADMLIDVWKLLLAPGQSTSMHCHPRKETVLMCLAGSLRIDFLDRSIEIGAGGFLRIPRGAFHSTDNTGPGDAHLIEVETPRNKFDLVRRRDRYGRQGQQYEALHRPCAIAALVDDPTAPCAKLRAADLQGLFGFEVLTGARIAALEDSPEFVVSLSIESAIGQTIDIRCRGDEAGFRLEPDLRYLAIRRT